MVYNVSMNIVLHISGVMMHWKNWLPKLAVFRNLYTLSVTAKGEHKVFFFQLQDYKCNVCLRAEHLVSFGSVLWQKISAELAKTALFSCCKSSFCCSHVSTISTVSKPHCCAMSHWIQCLAVADGRSHMSLSSPFSLDSWPKRSLEKLLNRPYDQKKPQLVQNRDILGSLYGRGLGTRNLVSWPR